jgi:putative ABC transport system permease protein
MANLLPRTVTAWRRDKPLALLAIAALAIGIGSATAIFTIIQAVLLNPLPYAQSDRWAALFGGSTVDPDSINGLSQTDLLAYRDQTHSFDAFGIYLLGGDFNLTAPGQPRHIEGIQVSPSLIPAIGIAPVAGRFFTASDGLNAALISQRLYRSLGAGILGQPITLSGQTYSVVGVLPAWFRLPVIGLDNRDSENDIWIPLKPPPNKNTADNYEYYSAYARLQPGVSLAQARADCVRVGSRLRRTYHPDVPTYTAALFGLRDSMVKTIRPLLLLLLISAVLLLLITCANVAGLLVSRSVGRSRETAIRVALGGSQSQLALQYFLESLWVSLAAAVLGLLFSAVFLRLLLSLAADYIPRYATISINSSALLCALALAFLTASLSALAPLWQAFRTPPNEVLSNGTRSSAGARSRNLSKGLVISEIALAFTLISAGALLLWHFQTLTGTSPGFNSQGLLTFQLSRTNASTGTPKQSAAFASRLLDALDSIPGVTNAAVSNQVPLTGCCLVAQIFPANPETRNADHEVNFIAVSPGYFKALGITLLAGRLLTAQDDRENPTPLVIDQAAAARYWPHQNAIGQMAHFNSPNGSLIQIVGIVPTISNKGLGQKPVPQIYINSSLINLDPMCFLVRSTLSSAGLAAAIRQAVAHVDPAQPTYSFQSMRQILGASLLFQRIEWIVVLFFALAALLMASLGIYGLTAYSVRLRTTEIGTRMALGSTGNQLLGLIIGDGFRLALYGILIGGFTTAIATRLVSHYFQVHELSAFPYIFSIAAVLALAAVASLVPAWRASILSPLVAIRDDSESVWQSARRAYQPAAPAEPLLLDATLLSEFIEASRKADSFQAVYQSSLQNLLSKIEAESALLLENTGATEFQCLAAFPAVGFTMLGIPENGFLLNRLRFYAAPMSFAAADLETSHRWATEQKPQQAAELELLQQIGLRLAAPLRTKTDLIGLLLFGTRRDSTEYTLAEKNLVAACAEQFALTIENARLNRRVLDQEKVRRDLDLASEVQKRLLPESTPQTPGVTSGAYTLAARSIGGDYYDFLQIGERTLGIALADVAGKGIAAALVMAVVQASLRIIAAEENISLPSLAVKMNRFLHKATGFSSYATFFYAQLDEDKHQLRYVNAGHNPPYLVRARSEGAPIEELSTGGIIIGMFPVANYEEAVVDLRPGDVLLAFTDGVTEALDTAGEEFGEDRLKTLVRRVASLPIQEITATISQELRDWIGTAPQHDDLTFIVVKVSQ